MNGGAFAALRHPMFLRIVRIGLGGIILAAALAKIGDGSGFALQIHNFRLAPLWSENLIAMTLPWIELCTGLALVVGIRDRAAGALALVMMLVFTAAVGSAWARGLDFECGCFGKATASHIGANKFIENIGLTLLALVASLPTRTSS